MYKTLVIALLASTALSHAASYTTYIGDTHPCQVSAMAVDANGNTYLTGGRIISYYESGNPITDVFIAKLDASGTLTLLGTFSGKGSDEANAIAVDSSGNIYIAGDSTSPDFPLRNPLQSIVYTLPSGTNVKTGFLMKLAADGAMVYSTYFGGTAGDSSLYGIAADSEGNAYVTGTTTAPDYPRTPGMPAGTVAPIGSIPPISGALFAKINPTGSQILYAGVLTAPEPGCEAGGEQGSSCFLLTSTYTSGAAIAVDPAGNAYIAGNATGLGLPTSTGALLANGIGAFVVKVNAAGTSLVYATYLGPGYLEPSVGTVATDFVDAIAADASGDAYISGYTEDPAFAVTTGAFQTTLEGSNAFVAEIDPSGGAMLWATYLGGMAKDAAQTIALDPAGDVWVSGTATSPDFPTTVSANAKGGEFLAELNSTGSALLYSARFPTATVATALVLDTSNTVHTAGASGLVSAFPAGAAPGQTAAPWLFGITNSAGGVLAGRVAPGELISLYGLNLGPASPAWATLDAAGFLPTTLGGLEVMINGIAAPLLYVSATQINAIAPVELTAQSSIELQVTGAALPDFRVMVDIAAPGVFLNAAGSAAAINQDGTLNSPSNPAPGGSYVSVWATGTGYFAGNDGQIAGGANQFCGPVGYCDIDYFPASYSPVSYIGAAPGLVNGVVQINFQVTAGVQSYTFTVDGLSSQPFGVAVAH